VRTDRVILNQARAVANPSSTHPAKTNKNTTPNAANVNTIVHTNGMAGLPALKGRSESGTEPTRDGRPKPRSILACFPSKISSLMRVKVRE